MKIWIVCSGQADLALPRCCTAGELARWCRQEAEAPWRVQPVQTVPSAGRMVYVSPRRAARESARAFCGQGECQTEPLLDEIPLAPFKEDKRPRPLWLWRLMARLQRRFGRKGQPESRRQAMERAEALIQKLESAGQDCVLVTHPAFLAVLLDRLRVHGYCSQRSGFGRLAPLERILCTRREIHCGGCGHNCLLSNPGCAIGKDQARRQRG